MKVLLTGATGFIGGTVLNQLLTSSDSTLKSLTITCLIRGADRAATLTKTYGSRITPVLYESLDDLSTTTAVAADHDIIISTTLGFHVASALALIHGLAQRKARTGKDVWMIHLSGTSNLAGFPITGDFYEPTREFDDAKDDIYAYEKEREERESYIQRATELSVIDTGLELGVKAVVLMPPTIYGVGTGLFNKRSIQIPTYIRAALEYKKAVVVGEGKGRIDHVHVVDLAELYEIILARIFSDNGDGIPTGQRGILFAENGNHTWRELAELVSTSLHRENLLDNEEVADISLTQGTKLFASYLQTLNEHMVESGLCGDSRTVASRARALGWKPHRGDEAWKQGIFDDIKAVLGERRQ